MGETLTLTPRGAGINYKWQDSTSTATFLVSQPGIYAIVASNVCNRATDSVNIYYQECNCTLFLPTGFSPNGDGRNDVFRPVYRCILGQYRLSIYNRWGDFVFFTSDPGVSWNGMHNGQMAAIGTYVWIVEYVDELTQKYYKKQGTVTLIR
jgi:gliding motility-associated-like protein